MYAPTLNVGRPARPFLQGDPSSHSSQEAFWEEELRLRIFPCFCCNSLRVLGRRQARARGWTGGIVMNENGNESVSCHGPVR